MLKVVTQDKTMKLEIKEYFYKEDDGVFCIVEKESLTVLGKYKTKERAQKVFNAMVGCEQWATELVAQPSNRGYQVLTKTYWMPEE